MRKIGDNLMTKIAFCILTIVLTACNNTASQSIKMLPDTNRNKTTAKSTPTATPASTLSECAKNRTYGLLESINIPQELCVDETKPIDKSERVNVPSGNNAAYSQIEETDAPFEKLPPEVRRIIKLTAPDANTNALLFSMTMLPVYDEISKKFVKSYIYDPFIKTRKAKAARTSSV